MVSRFTGGCSFAAIMSSVDSFILMVSSSLVRDVYQRFNPDASEKKIKE